jgi:two-component system, OmpR family, sensor histidine kinase TctE
LKPYSLLRRIALGLSVTMAIACVCGLAWLFVKATWANNTLRERALLAQARDIAGHVEISPKNTVELHLPPPLAEAYASSESRYRFAIRDADGQNLISNSGHVGPLPELNGKDHRVYEYDANQRQPRHVFGAVCRTQVGDRTIYVQVERLSRNTSSLAKAVLEEFLVDGEWLEFLFLFVLIGVCLWIVDRGLRPLRQMSEIARSIGPANAHIRFSTDNVPREILPCILSLNAVLERLEHGLERQKEFNANAAHQLRTPLAILSANVQLLDDPVAIGRLKIDVDHMTRIVSQLLLTAQLDNSTIDFAEIVDLDELVADVAANLGPLAINADKSIRLERSDTTLFVRTSSFALKATLQNLIENAIKHTPGKTSVLVRVTGLPAVDVIDSGPGISEELRPKVFERFWRGDKSADGAGLGLSIVQKIMTAMHGTVTVADAPGGGAQFTIRLPRDAIVEAGTEQAAPAAAERSTGDPTDENLAKVA